MPKTRENAGSPVHRLCMRSSSYCLLWTTIRRCSAHHDKRVARLLKEALARRRVPRSKRRLAGKGSGRLDDIMLDEDELEAGADLSDLLRQRLDQSRCLIVICSPFAVASDYVDREIAYFKSIGRADRILCVIASGVPNASDSGRAALECFPAALRLEVDPDARITERPIPVPDRPLAAALGQESKAEQLQVVNQISAALMGMTLSELHNRQRRGTLIRIVASVLLLLAAGGAALGYWDARYRLHYAYFKDYVRRLGKWEGVGPIDEATYRGRETSYQIVRRGRNGPVIEVRLVNSGGHCPAGGGIPSVLGVSLSRECADVRACSAEFDYGDKGVSSERL
jgi:hypothetical protein